MKKIALIAIAACATFSFTSCKKDYTCTCTDTTTGDAYTVKFTKTTKPTAKTSCDFLSTGGDKCSL